ncbi:MAG TPA: Hsp20/alpha crystallin family protein [Edaphocola sp.]|nr:Hsp20/alpha crystallin family protein [Edaphocola sp.]
MNNNTVNPVRTFGGLMEELFNNNGPRFFRDDFFNEDWKQHRRVPVNISETDDAYQLAVVAPGLKKDDLKIQVNDNTMTISFEKTETSKEEPTINNQKFLREEFRLQAFKRSFKLGEKVDAGNISARYENGILHLDIPKKEQVKAANKFIEIA